MATSRTVQIDVRVRTPTGKALRMSVALPDSSYRVVRELAEIEHKPLELVRVYFKGEQLNHDLMPARADFATHGHKPDYLVTGSLALTMEIAIQITVLAQHGAIFELFVAPSDTIEAVKHFCVQKFGVPKEPLRLFFAGFELNDGGTISRANIKHGATLLLVMSLHCGHCRGLPGFCACTVCLRPPVASCLVPLHCAHCRGLVGPCACGIHCVRPSKASCWPGHCKHCKGKSSLCSCDLCPRPANALCRSFGSTSTRMKDAADHAPLLYPSLGKLD